MSKIVLYQFACDWDLPNPSPFCFKIETWLRMAGLEYTIEPWSPKVGPLGKAPSVGIDGEIIADSNVIIDRLTEICDVELDAKLTDAQRAKATLARRTLEEHTYWVLMNHRWLDSAVWNSYRHIIGSAFPLPNAVKPALLGFLRRNTLKAAQGQGLNRHPKAEVISRGKGDFDAIATLFEGDFFLGDAPTSIDATLYAWAEEVAHAAHGGEMSAHLQADPRWMAYCQRMRDRFWSDWADKMPALSAAA